MTPEKAGKEIEENNNLKYNRIINEHAMDVWKDGWMEDGRTNEQINK